MSMITPPAFPNIAAVWLAGQTLLVSGCFRMLQKDCRVALIEPGAISVMIDLMKKSPEK